MEKIYHIDTTKIELGHGNKYTKYKMYLSTMMVMCNKQDKSNI